MYLELIKNHVTEREAQVRAEEREKVAAEMQREREDAKMISAALGAHIQADAYRSTFPDNDADAQYLKKQETWWRLMAHQWLPSNLSSDCANVAKLKVADSPAFKREIHAITEKLATYNDNRRG